MNSIIVDDEPKAIELLKSYIQHFSEIKLVGTFRNGFKAFEFISKETVDVIFLDINMPHISGLSLSKMIPAQVKVIFTTAYSEYAVESYDVQAIDYLLKPISLERFGKAMSKILVMKNNAPEGASNLKILVKSGTAYFRVNPNDILFLEKAGNYITYFLKDKKILSRASIKEAQQILPSSFIQIHKSYIINMNRVLCIDKNTVTVSDTSIPIGASFRQNLSRLLGED